MFVTAYDKYAVQAFAQGVLDYLVKPVEPARLGETVTRLRERLRTAEPASNTASVLRDLATSLKADVAAEPLRWVRASAGRTVRLIPVESIDFLRADQKYTRVAWRDDDGLPREDLIRLALRDIGEKLDRSQFIRVHRSVVVNLMSIDHVVHGANETADIHLKGRDEILPVSRTYMHHFRQM